MRDRLRRIPPPLRSVGIVLALVLIFGWGGSLLLGAFDLSQEAQQHGLDILQRTNLLNPVQLAQHTLHFLGAMLGVLTVSTDKFGEPLRNYFLRGVGLTIEFCFISMPLALVLGFILALMSGSRHDALRIPARTFVEFFRNTPLLVQLVAIYTGLLFLPKWFLDAFTAGVATLVLNYAAYECENIRAGIEAIDRGQTEAAQVLGLSYLQTLRQIIVPQMITVVLPPVINDLIYMYKDSSILSLITIQELTAQTNYLGKKEPGQAWEFFLIGGAVYLLLSIPLGRLARGVERRLKSATFLPGVDMTMAALQVLVVAVLVGLICGLLVGGFSLANVTNAVGQLFSAIALAVVIVLFTMVVLGAIVYVPTQVVKLLRRGGRRGSRGAGSPPASSGELALDAAPVALTK